MNERKGGMPLFVPQGPPCPEPGCKGVLWQHINHRTCLSWMQCTSCEKKVDEQPVSQRYANLLKTLALACKGPQV